MTAKQALGIYFDWSCRALLGGNPVGADNYLNNHLEVIKGVAQALLKKVEYTPKEIYRGVILNEPTLELDPHPNFTYLSFSENRRIAENFADPSEEGFGSLFFLGNYGYVIEHTPSLEDILFHFSFVDVLPYEEVFRRAGIENPLLKSQEEVTILQPEQRFTKIYIHESNKRNKEAKKQVENL